MRILIKLFILSIVAVLIGTVLMYGIEYNKPNSKIQSLEDALWWCVATVTTVGYGDVVPVTNFGRYVAIVYMGFGISMITLLISTITNNFYKKRIENEETKKDKEELEYFKKELMIKLSEIENKQNKCLDLFHQLYLTKGDVDNSKKNKNNNNNTNL